MRKMTDGTAPKWFDMPSDVERIAVCRKSGQRAAPECRSALMDDGRSNVYEDLFMAGTGPYETCAGHHTDPVPTESAASTTVLSDVF
jgi:hypothetical protein